MAGILQDIGRIFFEGTAVYIGADFIDVARARRTARGIALTSLQRIQISSDSEHGVDGVLDSVFSSGRQIPYRAAVNIRNDHVILRRFTIRNIPKAELSQAVSFAAQQHLPCPVDTLAYGFKTYQKTSNFREIALAAAETKHVRELVSRFRRKRILPAVIEPTPLLISKLIGMGHPDLNGACLAVHYEPQGRISICGISNRHPCFFKEYGIPAALTGSSWKGDEKEPYPTLKKIWPHIEADIIKSMNYIHKETGNKVDRLFVSGFSRSQDDDMVSRELNIPVERHKLDFMAKSPSGKDERYIPVIMLVLSSLEGACLNLAPEDVVRNDIWRVRHIFRKFLTGLVMILALHGVFIWLNTVTASRMCKEGGFSDCGSLKPSSPVEEIESYSRSVAESSSFISGLAARKYFLRDKMASLARLMPSASWAQSLNYSYGMTAGESPRLTVQGMILDGSANPVSASQILEAIKADGRMMEGFTSATLSYVEKKISYGKEVTEFEITFK